MTYISNNAFNIHPKNNYVKHGEKYLCPVSLLTCLTAFLVYLLIQHNLRSAFVVHKVWTKNI